MREAQDVQEPAQNIQYRCPLTEDQWPAAFALQQAVLLSPTALGALQEYSCQAILTTSTKLIAKTVHDRCSGSIHGTE